MSPAPANSGRFPNASAHVYAPDTANAQGQAAWIALDAALLLLPAQIELVGPIVPRQQLSQLLAPLVRTDLALATERVVEIFGGDEGHEYRRQFDPLKDLTETVARRLTTDAQAQRPLTRARVIEHLCSEMEQSLALALAAAFRSRANTRRWTQAVSGYDDLAQDRWLDAAHSVGREDFRSVAEAALRGENEIELRTVLRAMISRRHWEITHPRAARRLARRAAQA